MLDPFWNEITRGVMAQPRRSDPPKTITVDGVEYVRKEPALKYKVGDAVTFTGKVTAIDNDDLPYRVQLPGGRTLWLRKEALEG